MNGGFLTELEQLIEDSIVKLKGVVATNASTQASAGLTPVVEKKDNVDTKNQQKEVAQAETAVAVQEPVNKDENKTPVVKNAVNNNGQITLTNEVITPTTNSEPQNNGNDVTVVAELNPVELNQPKAENIQTESEEIKKEKQKKIKKEEVLVSKTESPKNELNKEIVADIDNSDQETEEDNQKEAEEENQEESEDSQEDEAAAKAEVEEALKNAQNTYTNIVKKFIGKNLQELQAEKEKITKTIDSSKDIQAKLNKLIDLEIHKGTNRNPKTLADLREKYQKAIDTEEELEAEIFMLDDLIQSKKAESEVNTSDNLEGLVSETFDDDLYGELEENGMNLTDEEKQVFETRFDDINNKKNKIARISTELTDKEPQHAIKYEDEGIEEKPVDNEDYSDDEEENYDDMAEDNFEDEDMPVPDDVQYDDEYVNYDDDEEYLDDSDDEAYADNFEDDEVDANYESEDDDEVDANYESEDDGEYEEGYNQDEDYTAQDDTYIDYPDDSKYYDTESGFLEYNY
jgi:hypothetical protein